MKMSALMCVAAVVLVVGLRSITSAQTAEVVTGSAVAPNVAGAGHSSEPVMTPDGRYVVFLSHANNLVTNDDLQPGFDVFVRDLQSSTTTLVSVNRFGTGGGDRDCGYPSISTNGRLVLFAGDARNLVPHDTNDAADIFLRDTIAGTTVLVSANTNGGVSRSSSPYARPVMSPDARWVVFESTAQDLVEGDTNQISDVFIRDTQSSVTRLVSVGAERAPSGRSHSPSVAHDGRRVAFVSNVGNLIPGHTNRNGDVYVQDLLTSTTFWASSNLVEYFNNGPDGFRCFDPVISPDGHYVAFKGALSLTSAVHTFYHDLQTGTTEVIATNSHACTAPDASTDGRWLAFEENDAVYLRDIENQTNLLVSINVLGSGPANGKSLRPVVAPDGAHVAFVSSATDLVAITPAEPTNISRLYVRDVLAGVTRLVGVATNGTPSRFDMEDVLPALSANGQLVGFDTDASDIVRDDNNHFYDVFVRDFTAGVTELVSVHEVARPARTGFQSAGISPRSLSGDARRLAFTSHDDDRVPQDTNGMVDIFVRDFETGELFAHSASNGVFTASANAVQPILSQNGESLLFLRENQTGMSYGHTYDLLWRTVDGTSEFLIESNFGLWPLSWRADLNGDGTLVAFASMHVGALRLYDTAARTNRILLNQSANNPRFSPNGQWVLANNAPLLAVHVESGQSMVVSKDTNGSTIVAVPGVAFDSSGRYLAFRGSGRVYRFDFQATNTTFICTNCFEPSLNHDGNLIAVSALKTGSQTDIYVVNVTNGGMTLISRDYAGNGGGNARSSSPLISGDGRYVVFVSTASNLVLNDTNKAADIFVHDRVQGVTMLMTRNRNGTGSGNALSSTPVLSRDGRTVVFQSFAGDLVEGDYNERRDIFLLRLGVGDSDNDGIDDDWEVAYFNDLNRDGAGDLDDDGQTDRQEFVSGTDPTNNGSVLRVLTVSPMGGGSTTIMWSAVPTRNYVVQFKDSLSAANWSNASGVLTASSNSESFLHPSSAAQRYYRVIAVQ